jgi:Sigma-70, region 4
VVLESLTPAERLAFVPHDMFAVPFEEIAPMIERSPAAARQLASRARRRVQGQAPAPDPDVVLRSDGGRTCPRLTFVLQGARAVSSQALASGRLSPFVRPALINGAAGADEFGRRGWSVRA